MASVLQGEDSMAAAATESGSMADALQEKDGKSADAGHPQEKGSAGGRALRREAPLSMLVPPAVLAAFAVGFGILPGAPPFSGSCLPRSIELGMLACQNILYFCPSFFRF